MADDFNPHHHAGGDTLTFTVTFMWVNFNPHHHAGGDGEILTGEQGRKQISIHTTTQVVTSTPTPNQ